MHAGYLRLQQTFDRLSAHLPAVCQHLFFFFLGVAAGRSSLGGLTPFPTALAVLLPYLPEGRAWPLLAGLLLGVFARGRLYAWRNPLADALAVLFAALLAFRLRRGGDGPPLTYFSAVAGCAVLLMKAGLGLLIGDGLGFIPALFGEAALSAVFAPVFFCILSEFPLEKKGLVRFLLFLFLVLCGLGSLGIGSLEVREVVVRSLLLTVAGFEGAAWGAGAGVLLGLVVGEPWQMLPRMGFYAGLGFCSGILRGLGRAGVLLGFGVGILLFSFFYETKAGFQGHLIASALASVLYLACSPFLGHLLGRNHRGSPPPTCRLQVETGFAQLARPDEPLCGDSLVAVPLDAHRFLLVVSDGMGTGINAGRESRIVTRMMEQLISGGAPLDVAAGAVNTALYMRGGEESAATIDLALIDLSRGIVEFLKAGAPPSFIKSGKNVEMIRSLCWPAGILDKLEPEVLRREIRQGDMLIMATDGVTGVEEGEAAPGEWLYGFLQELAVEEPQAVADLILKQALKRNPQRRDDMAVLAARFYDISDTG